VLFSAKNYDDDVALSSSSRVPWRQRPSGGSFVHKLLLCVLF
jgi:hypothetical protein